MLIGEKSGGNKVKFMCSFGGKIIPRPSDGVLKYVGGETRVIAVPHDISFFDLRRKLTKITKNDVVLKYQIIQEELDALVSVKSDEDLKNMMEEYNRHEPPKLRTYLFPANPVILENQMEPLTLEQRFIEAINGIVRTTKGRGPIKTRPSFTVSASSSPRSESSPDPEPSEFSYRSNKMSQLYPMQKVRSSPNISHQLHPHNHHHNASFQHPNYFMCSLRPQHSPLDFSRGTGWEPQGRSNVKRGFNEDPRFWGRASSVPQSPRKY